jgi:hypothetical protein
MSLWDSVGTTYVEAATSALPLHRAVVFAAGVFGSLAVHNQTHRSIFETVAQLPLAEMASLSTGPLSKAMLADLMFGIGAVICGWVFSRFSLHLVFALAARSTDFWARIKEAQAQVPIDSTQPLADRQKAMELIDASLKEPRARLRSLGSAAELAGGLGVASLVAAHWGNALDVAFGAVLVLVSLGLQVSSVRVFIADYFGPALYKARLQGKKPPTPARIS